MPSSVSPKRPELIELDPTTFPEFPEFKPDLTPLAMLRLGVFGGFPFPDVDDPRSEVFTRAGDQRVRLGFYYDPSVNCFGIEGYSPLRDPSLVAEWFRWYCGFYAGERGTQDRSMVETWVLRREILRRKMRSEFGPRKRLRQRLLELACDPHFDVRGE